MKNTIYKPDGLALIEDIRRDILISLTNTNSSLSVRVLNNLLTKVNVIIEVLKYKPRLPLYQIEHEIIDICRKDKSTHGVICNFLFTTKFGEIDYSRLSSLNVKL